MFAHQIHCLNRQFSNLLNYAAIEREKEKANGYIEMPNTMGEVEVTNLVSKLMIAEQTLETLIRGPKSLASTSNPWHLLRLLKSDAHAQDHAQALQTLATTNYNGALCFDRPYSVNQFVTSTFFVFRGIITTDCSGM